MPVTAQTVSAGADAKTALSPPAHLPATLSRAPNSAARFAIVSIDYWHLLSLDAPTVAMLWTWFLAKANHVMLPMTSILAMGIAVWLLYAADRLLDARTLDARTLNDRTSNAVILDLRDAKKKNHRISLETPALRLDELEPRHYFHRQHQRAFRFGIVIASAALAWLLPGLAPPSIRLYLALGTLLFAYFILIHVNSGNTAAKGRRLPKELAVGLFFSAATFIPTVARNPSLRLALLPGAVLFAFICGLNCLFIYAWEHPATSPDAHFATRLALRFLPPLALAAAIVGLLLSALDHGLPWRIPGACAIAAFLLLLIHRNRHRFAPTTLRAAADLCLLTPLLLLPMLGR